LVVARSKKMATRFSRDARDDNTLRLMNIELSEVRRGWIRIFLDRFHVSLDLLQPGRQGPPKESRDRRYGMQSVNLQCERPDDRRPKNDIGSKRLSEFLRC
jgi:hypothetical protein